MGMAYLSYVYNSETQSQTNEPFDHLDKLGIFNKLTAQSGRL